jgi:hypothetical protein
MHTPATAPAVPASAYHAVRYADWCDSVFCTIGAHRYLSHRATEHQRRRALASFELAAVARYSIVDCFQDGAALYYAPAPAPTGYSPFGAMVLGAVRQLRRWRYYAAEDTAPAVANAPLDGCHCRVCIERGGG